MLVVVEVPRRSLKKIHVDGRIESCPLKTDSVGPLLRQLLSSSM